MSCTSSYKWPLAALLIFMIKFIFVVSEPETHCLNDLAPDQLGEVTLSCRSNDIIVLDDAYFGRSRYGGCAISTEDCVEKTKVFDACEGLNNCTRVFKTFSSKCDGSISALFLSYSCVQPLLPPVQKPNLGASSMTHKTYTDETNDVSNIPNNIQTVEKTNNNIKAVENTDTKGDDTGLIVGCAVAALVTIFMLLVAIVMVIRQLLQNNTNNRNSNGRPETSSKVIICMSSLCTKLDKLPCFTPYATSGGSGHSGQTCLKVSCTSDSDADLRKISSAGPRVAPVGEESDVPRVYHPKNRPVPSAPSPSPSSQQNNADTSCVEHASRRMNSSVLKTPNQQENQHTTKINVSSESKNCPDKIISWREKGMADNSSCNSKNNNNDFSVTIEDSNTRKYPLQYDAVAIPNTEAVTGC